MRHIIFITGLPRSGTKLLRDLMNQHSLISIPRIETVLFPYLVNKYGLQFDLKKTENFEMVKSEIERSTFYQNFLKHGLRMDLDTIAQEADKINWACLFEELLKFYGPKEYKKELIIGDKTPGYIDHTDLLLNIWPEAKFIHIVRDPRDYLCSVNQVWNKNIYRAANRWNKTIMNLEQRQRLNAQNMHTVYYEHLLEQPVETLTSICQYLGIDFEDSMLTLEESSELFGDAKGSTAIVRGNQQKYRQKLSKKQIYKIEQLVCSGARVHGYQLDNPEIKLKKLSRLALLRHKYMDGLNALKFHIRNKGLLDGSKYFFKLNQTNIKRS
jgi:hypothetical protein